MTDHKTLRLGFAGTPEFAQSSLAALIAADLKPVAVWTQPDRPAGRGRKLRPSPVKQTALDHDIAVFQPKSLKPEDAQAEMREQQLDLLIVVAYGLLLPQAVLDIPTHGCWNVHASLLPRWRGAAPIHRAVLAGDRSTGCCIMQMDAGLDTGAVLSRTEIPIVPTDTTGVVHDKLAGLGADLLVQTVQSLISGTPPQPTAQSEQGVTYAHKLDKSECALDCSADAPSLARQVRGLNPWPVATLNLHGETWRIWQAHALEGKPASAPGTIVSSSAEGIDIACGSGILRVTRLQKPGSKPWSAQDYMNARASQR